MKKNQPPIFTAISYSYICFIDEYLNILKNPLFSSIQYIDQDTADIAAEIRSLFLTLQSLIGAEEDFKEAYAKKLVSFREVLEKKYRSLYAYRRELQHASSLFNLEYALTDEAFAESGLTEADALTMDYENIVKDCSSFIFAGKTLQDRQLHASVILPYVPMRMTKDSFLSYVEKSINLVEIENTAQSAQLLVSVLRQLLDGTLYEAYGEEFIDIAESICELKSLEDADEFSESSELVEEMLEQSLEIVEGLYKVICTLSNLLIFDALTFETLTELNMSFSDFYYSLKNILSQSEETEVFLETLPERVEAVKEQIHAEYIKACKSSDIDPLFSLIQTYLLMDVRQVFGFSTSKHDPYSLEVNDVFRGFFAELKEYLSSHSPKERKLRMQYFMSIIPFSMNEKTLETYIMQGFNNTAHPKRNLVTAMYLTNTLEENGFFEAHAQNKEASSHYVPENWEDDEYAHDEHDHHDHSCNCGEDHHDCHCDDGECDCNHH